MKISGRSQHDIVPEYPAEAAREAVTNAISSVPGLRSSYAIAQDQTSFAVYGMPKAATELGAATEVLPQEQIARHLGAAVAGKELFFTSPGQPIN